MIMSKKTTAAPKKKVQTVYKQLSVVREGDTFVAYGNNGRRVAESDTYIGLVKAAGRKGYYVEE